MSALPFKVKAIYEYVSEHDDDLQFPIGQIITVTELEGDDWYVGEYSEATGVKKEGLFPANFVEKYEPEVPTRPSRPSRPKQETQSPVSAAPAPAVKEEEKEEEPAPPSSAPPMGVSSVDVPAAAKSPPQTTHEPPPASKPAPSEPTQQPAASTAPVAKKAPPPVAAKSNAFKDRIAAFNQPAAAPIAPLQSGRKLPANDFIKKPFVAPPPSKNAYVPQPKATPVQKPYHREEDPEIKQRQDEDRAAAEAAGLTNESSGPAQNEAEDEPKPMTLKERMALLQQQQQEQAQKRAETAQKKKPPITKSSETDSGAAGDIGEADEEQIRTIRSPKQSLDVPRAKPPIPAMQDSFEEQFAVVAEPEMLSDSHDADQSGAGELTEDDSGPLGPHESDEQTASVQPPLAAPIAVPAHHDAHNGPEGDEEAEEDEDDSMDEEERRKQALRARMARLGGAQPGMGAMLGFGAPPPAPPKKKSTPKEPQDGEEVQSSSPPEQQQRIAMVPIPGMPRMQSPESDATQREQQHDDDEEEEEEEEDDGQEPPITAPPPPRRSLTSERSAPPPIPKESRPLPPPPTQEPGSAPPVPSASRPPAPESRPVPPPPPAAVMSPGPGSESDDEMSMHAKPSDAENSGVATPLPIRPGPPPVPGSRDVPPRPIQSPPDKRSSYFSGSEPASATSDKRSSRAVPPVPGSPINSSRPPPPPPPTQSTSRRQSTMDRSPVHDDEGERISSDYDGDYDTDIASSAKHKDALRAPHSRETSLTDSPNVEDEDYNAITPIPTASQAAAPRAIPPPPPSSAPKSRPSIDRPPPPVPPPRIEADEVEYDPYRHERQDRAVPPPPSAVPMAAPPVPPPHAPGRLLDESSADDIYEEPPQLARKSTERAPPPPPQEKALATAMSQAPAPRQSLDVGRSGSVARRSTEQARPSGEHGQIAADIDLGTNTTWWTAPMPLPPVFQSRIGVDLLSECEESSKSKRGGRKEITKDIYVLFMDYSQTVISARYDSQDPTDVVLEQRHEPPPAKLRQDQLEGAWQRFGKSIAEAAHVLGNNKKDSTVGEGAPATLPFELIKARPDALLPVGIRAYGALVYSNLANASTMQFDEIRPGDIITVRNAKFEGHHGAMKSKYKADYGPSHVAVVEEWDGTKRAVRAWEQGRDKKGSVRSEKFRLADLRSGEVRVWRVVGRDWVGWDS